jgi:hypothetical protein
MEHDHLNKPNRTTNRGAGWRRDTDTGMSWLLPVLAVGALLLAGLLYFANIGDRESNTQVGQNTERPASPATKPSTPPKQQ